MASEYLSLFPNALLPARQYIHRTRDSNIPSKAVPEQKNIWIFFYKERKSENLKQSDAFQGFFSRVPFT